MTVPAYRPGSLLSFWGLEELDQHITRRRFLIVGDRTAPNDDRPWPTIAVFWADSGLVRFFPFREFEHRLETGAFRVEVF